jgi:YidC/Oxa1 family membrane protein insertase
MDRTAWIVVVLCVFGLVAWEWWIARQTPRRPPAAPAPSPAATATAPGVSPSVSPSPALPVPSATPQSVETVAPFPEKIETLRNNQIELHLTNRGGGIREAVLLHQIAEDHKRVILNSPRQAPIGAMVEQPAAPVLREFKPVRGADGSVTYERTFADGLAIHKKFFFPQSKQTGENFLIDLDIDATNGSAKPYANGGYYLALGSAVPIHAKDYPYYTRLVWCIQGKAKGVDVNWFGGSGGFLGIGSHPPRPVYQEDLGNAEWVAVTDQFFTTLIAPLTAKSNGVWGTRFEISAEKKTYGVEGAMRMPGFQLPPGQTYHARFQIWAGPKIYHRLSQLDHNEAEIMDFGMFKIVSQFLLNFLNLLHGWVGNYGLAVLALTAVIRLVLWPLQTKANQSMRKTALLAPKMQELKEKYKDDPTRMNQEVMKLYKQYGINPVGGCLPMAIQIPIFFGLYKMLAQAVELRGQTFLWVHDLSQPDTVAHLPGLGWPINIIPLCMAVTQIWLMQMTPKTGDSTQRRIMMFTPLIFLFICYNFAAALALYYTTQNLFSILQFYLNKKQPMPKLEKAATSAKRKR